MKLVTYDYQGQVSIGLLMKGQVVDILAGLEAIGAGKCLPPGCDMKGLLPGGWRWGAEAGLREFGPLAGGYAALG